MEIAYHRFHPFVEHMRIDLRRGNVGVSEQFLNDTQIGAVLQQMAREGMAQHMRAHARNGDSGARGDRLDVARENLPAQMAAGAFGGKQPWPAGQVSFFEQSTVSGDRSLRRFGERNEALASAFAADEDQRLVAPRRGLGERHEFRNPEAGRVKEFEQTSGARRVHALRIIRRARVDCRLRRRKQALDFFDGENFWQP